MEPRAMDDQQKTDQDALATSSEVEPVSGPRCPWCSAAHPAESQVCPSCGATLIAREDALEREVIGVTTIDPGLVEHDQWLRSRREKKRRSVLGTLLGRDDDAIAPTAGPRTVFATPVAGAAILPPSDEVKREIARLEIEAAYVRAQSEAEARAIEQRIEEIDAAAARGSATAATDPTTEDAAAAVETASTEPDPSNRAAHAGTPAPAAGAAAAPPPDTAAGPAAAEIAE